MADVPVSYRVLDPHSQEWLLARCREAIGRHIAHEPPPREPEHVPILCQQRLACFVTLHTSTAQLRGCVGALDNHDPLWRQAANMAIAAATRDPRFPPLRTKELENIVIEVAALSPRKAAQPKDIKIGRHGLWIEQGVHKGVLLPQAALNYGWDKETFLKEGCVRAGLPGDAWHKGKVNIAVFTADVFTETARLQ